jgi:alkylation response protein AidB-like acyl-CoA dehydrogenase
MTSVPSHLSASDILASTHEIIPMLREFGNEIEAARQLPKQVLDALTRTGVFRMVMPKAWGGPEVDPVTQIRIIENLAQGDASAAWTAMILAGSGFYASYLEEPEAKNIFGSLDVRAAGSLKWTGTAEKTAGGYQVSGHWDFGSGCHHADYVTAGCQLTQNGQPLIGEHGMPSITWVLIPASAIHIADTWHTTGLAGSGSDDYTLNNYFVPDKHAFNFGVSKRSEPLYTYTSLSLYRLIGVQLGIARHAIEAATDVARKKKLLLSDQSLSVEQWVQMDLARAEAVLESARNYVFHVVDDVWASLEAKKPLTLEQRARGLLGMVHASEASQTVVDLMCNVAGATAIFKKNPFDRLRRDLITANTHFLCQKRQYASVGQALLGIEPAFPYF